MTDEEFHKSEALTDKELVDIRAYIKALQSKGSMAKNTITHLQHFNKKLSELWKAERVYYTEIKRKDTKEIGVAGEELGIDKYRVILSPHACDTCEKQSNYGKKKYDNTDIQKTGYGHIPPYHPNCYCCLLPE